MADKNRGKNIMPLKLRKVERSKLDNEDADDEEYWMDDFNALPDNDAESEEETGLNKSYTSPKKTVGKVKIFNFDKLYEIKIQLMIITTFCN